jgi:hypothetical protein
MRSDRVLRQRERRNQQQKSDHLSIVTQFPMATRPLPDAAQRSNSGRA